MLTDPGRVQAFMHNFLFTHPGPGRGKTPTNLYLDFSKAFNKLVHSVLLHKCKHYGIDGLAYKLIESYLENRK